MSETDPLTMWREAMSNISHLPTSPMSPNEFYRGVAQGHANAVALARAALAALPEKGEVMARRRNFLREWPPAVSRAYRGGYRRVLVIDCPEDTSGSPE
jgi:hypothetical protein